MTGDPKPRPPLPATLAGLPRYAAEAFGQREALADGEVRWSFARLAEEVAAASRAALAHGVRPGDRVAMWAPNSREWIAAALGAIGAGAVLVPLNTRYKAPEAADILRRSGATLLFAERDFLGTDYVAALHASGEDLGSLRTTVVLRGDATGPALDSRTPELRTPELRTPEPRTPDSRTTLSWADYLAAGTRIPDADRVARAAAVRPGGLCDILYTSGTTGRPKGVMMTHAQTLRLYDSWSRLVTLREGDRYLLVNPFFHAFGYKAGVLACLLRGATMLPETVYDADRVLHRLAAERVTCLMGPPTVFHGLLAHPERATHDLSALRLVGTGAAAVPAELVERIRNSLGARDVFTAYGLTESGGVVTVCPTDADARTVARTVGLPLPGTEVRVVAPSGGTLPAGEPGEVQVRGYHVMRGYLDDPAATAESVLPDGWLRTGDVGILDARGYLSLTDRLTDMYVVGGFNTYPAEVENVLLGHPAIADVAVVGAPGYRLGEVGVAFVVPQQAAQTTQLTPEALTAWTRERLANFKVPRRFVLVESLPRNTGGKLLKGRLRRAARGEETPPA
ncbi:acyl-CoA synthetase [Streptomyces spiroverticillatus]|uniref:Acyl-CoA synthetase n=1 Tax=Streptomyces finlayi TaxID=67296 RepID=A0A918WXG7_9ACTN|nr:FadD3 family acyl-CoA ligase [Streptomyces finlayi]GGZ92656.1 acyl-CoA synthetase [Streptomyces spiroverticillatus]GHC92894.1 acyl-CoA synthetase [Streptomyces finlayi]